MSPAVLSPSTRRDLLDAVEWIAKDNPAAARALRGSVAAAAAWIGLHPAIGTLRPQLADPPYRFLPLTGFPYVLVCRADRRPPLILRILHAARDLPELLRPE